MGVAGDPIFGFLDPDLPIHITFMDDGATMTIKSSLQVSIPIVKAFFDAKFSKSRRKLAKICVFGEKGVEM